MNGGPGALFALCVGGLILAIWITLVVTCCIKRKNVYDQSTVYEQTPVVVTSATHTAPGGYTMTQMPIGSTTTSYQTPAYSAPYPPEGVGCNTVPYPIMVSGNMNPPSYDAVVSNVVVNETQTFCNTNYRM